MAEQAKETKSGLQRTSNIVVINVLDLVVSLGFVAWCLCSVKS